MLCENKIYVVTCVCRHICVKIMVYTHKMLERGWGGSRPTPL